MSQEAFDVCRSVAENMSRVVLGKPQVVRRVVMALIAGEHLLLEDVPGVGKTLIARALAASIGGSHARLQFTPDLLPSDITGTTIYRTDERRFEFTPGPIFSQVVLADEINRAPPRTQSALLEAMAEGSVSIDGETRPLPQPFIVVATQNPFEYEGTYPLPESQLDRFMMRIGVGYPSRGVEREVLTSHRTGEPVTSLRSVADGEAVMRVREFVRGVRVDESIADYVLDIVDATRRFDGFEAGVSTRGALSLYRAAQASAVTDGRDFVTPDDVKSIAVETLAHRVLPEGVLQGGRRDRIESQVRDLVEQIPVPI